MKKSFIFLFLAVVISGPSELPASPPVVKSPPESYRIFRTGSKPLVYIPPQAVEPGREFTLRLVIVDPDFYRAYRQDRHTREDPSRMPRLLSRGQDNDGYQAGYNFSGSSYRAPRFSAPSVPGPVGLEITITDDGFIMPPDKGEREDDGAVYSFSPGVIEVVDLKKIQARPPSGQVKAGDNIRVEAIGLDAAGKEYPVFPDWSCPAPAGEIDQWGVFSSFTQCRGEIILTGVTPGGLSTTATVTVLPPE